MPYFDTSLMVHTYCCDYIALYLCKKYMYSHLHNSEGYITVKC